MSGPVLDEPKHLANERSESQVDETMARVKVKSSPCYLIVTALTNYLLRRSIYRTLTKGF